MSMNPFRDKIDRYLDERTHACHKWPNTPTGIIAGLTLCEKCREPWSPEIAKEPCLGYDRHAVEQEPVEELEW